MLVSSHTSSQSVVTGMVMAFLQNIPPFQFLAPTELARLASHMTLEFFPKDAVILSARSQIRPLYVVHKGGVKLALTSQVGKRMTLDMRSEGEMFGLLSVMGREPARLDVTAIEDTLCYSIPAEEVQRLISTQPEFANYLIRTSLSRYMDRSLQALRTQAGLMGDSERLLYSLAAGDVVSSPPLLCQKETTIREAAHMLASTNATCVFVVGRDGAAEGLLTDRDFAAKVVSEALSLELPVTRIMSQQ